jgi:SulP family sulfate permease
MSEAAPLEAEESIKTATWREMLFRFVPAFDSLRNYSRRDFGLDTMAGLTVAAVAVPQAMAYAQIAGIPLEYGLYTAIVMTAVGALFDSSKQLINGPTNTISIAVLSALVGFSEADRIPAAILLAFLVGAIQMGITLMRLGDLTRYISHAVIVGFTLGAAVLLVLDQVKNLLGLRSQGTGEDHFLKRFWLTLSHIEETNVPALLVGLGAIAVALALRFVNWRWRIRLPDLLIAVVGMAAVVWHFDLEDKNVDIVRDIPASLPTFELPHFDWNHVRMLTSSSFAIALLGMLEALAMAKAIAVQTGQKLDINQQCLSSGPA